MTNLLFSFQGRVNRAKFWLVHLGIVVIEFILFAAIFGTTAMTLDPAQAADLSVGPIAGIVLFVFFVLVAWIGLAVGVKRFHDRNKSGWWVLLPLVPVIGAIWYLIECGFLGGTHGPNNYGSDPLAVL